MSLFPRLRRYVLLVVTLAHGSALLWLFRVHKVPVPEPPGIGFSTPVTSVPAVVTIAPPKQTLIDRARRVTTLKNGEDTHQWLSNHELLIVEAVYDSPQIVVSVLDTETGKRRPLSGVNRALKAKDGGTSTWSYQSCEVSPDGRWLMEHDRGGTNLMHLDGSHLRHVEDGGRWDSIIWLKDSRHWLNFYGGCNGHWLDYEEVSLYRAIFKSQ